MKRWITVAAFALSFVLTIFISTNDVITAESKESKIDANCAYNGVQLYGRVQIVNDFPDIKVKKVDNFADLHVQQVEKSAEKCGKWQIVNEFADFKVKFVDYFEDITVKAVEDSPGLP